MSIGHHGLIIEPIEFREIGHPADPVQVARAYTKAGADELFLMGREAPAERLAEITEQVGRAVSIPFALDMDLATVEEIGEGLEAGAARALIQRSALQDPDFISELASAFGSQAIGVVVEVEREDDHWRVRAGPGGEPTEWDAVNWARVVEAQGGGELVLASPDGGPYGEPFDLELLEAISAAVRTPVVALGDAQTIEDLFDALMIGNTDGVLVGSLLHSGAHTVREIKEYLSEHGLSVRLD